MALKEIKFSNLQISTATCSGYIIDTDKEVDEGDPFLKITQNVNILALAKYVKLNMPLTGIKMVYAGNKSTIVRGTCKPSKKAKGFSSQVTFNAYVNDSMLSYKLFHNGKFQLTGARCIEDAVIGLNALLDQVKDIDGLYQIALKTNKDVLISHDDLLYSIKGDIIGYFCGDNDYYLNNEHVELSPDRRMLQSKHWSHNKKHLYSLDGIFLGTMVMTLSKGITKSILRKNFVIHDNMIVYDNKIIGTITTEWSCDDAQKVIQVSMDNRSRWLADKMTLISNVRVFPLGNGLKRVESKDVELHNVNVRFDINRKIYRDVLWEYLVRQGFNVRFDSMTHVGVNFRYRYRGTIHDSALNPETQGKCVCEGRLNMCCNECNTVSILCFSSGKVVVTGLTTLEEATLIARFMEDIYKKLPNDDEVPASIQESSPLSSLRTPIQAS